MGNPPEIWGSELFAGLSEPERARLATLGKERKLAPGQILFRLGEEADALFVVAEGRVDLVFPLMVMGEIKDVRMQGLDAGRALAWSALVPPHKLTVTARAASAARVVAFAREDLLALFEEQPRLARQILGNLTRVIGARLLEMQAFWVREVQRNVSQTYR